MFSFIWNKQKFNKNDKLMEYCRKSTDDSIIKLVERKKSEINNKGILNLLNIPNHNSHLELIQDTNLITFILFLSIPSFIFYFNKKY